jgi:ribosomal protein RSM22 (predicted rRNA methylase)
LKINRSLIKSNLIEPLEKEADLIRAIKTIRNNFTVERDKIGDYCLNPQLVSAYSLFYLITNLPKFPFIFHQLPLNIKERFQYYDFIDFGTGPGTYLLSHFLTIEDFKGHYYGVDNSSLMRKQANKLLTAFGLKQDQFSLVEEISEISFDNENKKILFFGNSFNEIEIKLFKKIIAKVNPDIIFFLEPGTKESFRKILSIRNELFKQGYSCHFPCPSGQLKCPMSDNQDWCHQILRIVHDDETQRLSQLVQLDRNNMPLTAQVFSTIERSVRKELSGFMVRRLEDSKHSFKWQICLDEDNYKGLYEAEIYKKEFSKSELKYFKKISTGVSFNFKVEKELSQKRLRITLLDFDFL